MSPLETSADSTLASEQASSTAKTAQTASPVLEAAASHASTAAHPTVAALSDAEVAVLRRDFAALADEVNGQPLAYLDSAATAQRPASVIAAESDFLEHSNGAVHRGAHTLAGLATEAYEDARATVADFIGANPDEIVWTSNATDALNLVAYGMSNASLGRGGEAARRFALAPGDEILVTEAEHHANLIPWQELAALSGATLRFIPVDDNGIYTLADAEAALTDNTRVVAIGHVSNVTGFVAPVAEITALAHKRGALVVLDACQSAPHRRINVAELGVDFLALSGHKMLGPTGIGVLYGRAELLNALPPFRTGGSMISTVTMTEATYMPAPQRFEAGTQPVSQAVALAEAVRYLEAVGVDRIDERENELAQRMLAGLATIEGIRVVGPAIGVPRAGLVSFDVDGVHAHDVGQYLDSLGIAARVGHHCAQPLHRRLGLTATTRASAYLYTTTDEIDRFLEAVAGVRPYFGVAEPAAPAEPTAPAEATALTSDATTTTETTGTHA